MLKKGVVGNNIETNIIQNMTINPDSKYGSNPRKSVFETNTYKVRVKNTPAVIATLSMTSNVLPWKAYDAVNVPSKYDSDKVNNMNKTTLYG